MTDLLVFLSDFHFGRATSGWNAKRAAESLRKIAGQIQAIAPRNSRIHLLFLGDIMDGENVYPEQSFELELIGFEQVFEGALVFLENLILPLSKSYPLHLDGVPGNHAYIRTASRKTNLDAFFYATLEQFIREHKLVVETTFWKRRKEDSLEVKLTVCGKVKVLIGHGHFLRSAAEVPFAGAQRRILSWLATFKQGFDIAAFGHYHRFAFYRVAGGKFVLFNGCLLHYDDYGLTRFGSHGDRLWAAISFSSDGKFQALHLLSDEIPKTDRKLKMESLSRNKLRDDEHRTTQR